jgi:hypothetical protein
MYKWFLLKEKKNSLPIFFLSSNDTLFRFLLPIPNSEFGCYSPLAAGVTAVACPQPREEAVVVEVAGEADGEGEHAGKQ